MGLVEVDHRVELFGKPRLEVVALPLGLGPVDHADGPLQPQPAQLRLAADDGEVVLALVVAVPSYVEKPTSNVSAG